MNYVFVGLFLLCVGSIASILTQLFVAIGISGSIAIAAVSIFSFCMGIITRAWAEKQ